MHDNMATRFGLARSVQCLWFHCQDTTQENAMVEDVAFRKLYENLCQRVPVFIGNPHKAEKIK